MRCVLPLLLFAAILSSSQLQAGDYRYTLGVGIEYSTGDYGTEETTDSWTVPLTLRWLPTDRLDIEFVLPYIHQSASTTVQMGGKRFPYQGGDGSGNSGTGNPGSGSGNPGSGSGIQPAQVTAEAGATTATSRSESGLGDADLTIGFTVFREGEWTPLVRSLAYLKFPTGDESSGLGTGAWDVGGGLGLAKWSGSWSWYLEGMYIVPGSSDDFDPDPYWTWLASGSRRFGDHLRVGGAISGATAPFPGESDALEAKVRVNWWASERTAVGGYLARGLDDGSPDWGAGVSVAVDF